MRDANTWYRTAFVARPHHMDLIEIVVPVSEVTSRAESASLARNAIHKFDYPRPCRQQICGRRPSSPDEPHGCRGRNVRGGAYEGGEPGEKWRAAFGVVVDPCASEPTSRITRGRDTCGTARHPSRSRTRSRRSDVHRMAASRVRAAWISVGAPDQCADGSSISPSAPWPVRR